jgi:hypothetical protein
MTFTATLTAVGSGAGTPSGNVLFKANGVPVGDPMELNSSGVATLTLPAGSLPHGANTVTNEYAGDGNFLGSTNYVVQIVNAPPTSPDTVASTAQNQAMALAVAKLLAKASDPDAGDILSVTAASSSAHGSVVLDSGAGTVTYTPATDYTGSDSFTYTVSDNYGGTVTPTVTVTVTSGNATPPNVVSPPTYDSASGTFSVTFAGIPGTQYTVQYASEPDGTWSFLKTATAGEDGLFVVTDTPIPPVSARYYRTVYP